MVSHRKTILFVCTHNSARSQLAEAILRQKFREYYETFSAGTKPTTINSFVSQVLTEMGIDTTNHKVKSVSEFLEQEIDLVVTVCDSAKETCPYIPGAKQYVHKSFKDPNVFSGTNEEILKGVRGIRDEISNWIEEKFAPPSQKP